MRRTGDQVQVNVQLIDTESGAHLWADRFDTDRRDLANAQAEITFRLARMLNVKLVAAEATRSEQRKALDPDARDFVMRGWDWFYRPTSPTTLKEARRLSSARSKSTRGPTTPGSAWQRSRRLGHGGDDAARFCFARCSARRAVAARSHRARSEQLAGARGNGESSPAPKKPIARSTDRVRDSTCPRPQQFRRGQQLGWAVGKPRRTRGLHRTGGEKPAAQPARSGVWNSLRATGQSAICS